MTAFESAAAPYFGPVELKRDASPGLLAKPIQPEKYYSEARINSGDRIICRIEAGTIFFVDVVRHDDISRYGKRPRA